MLFPDTYYCHPVEETSCEVITSRDHNATPHIDKAPFSFTVVWIFVVPSKYVTDIHSGQAFGKTNGKTKLWFDDKSTILINEAPLLTDFYFGKPFRKRFRIVKFRLDHEFPCFIYVPVFVVDLDGGETLRKAFFVRLEERKLRRNRICPGLINESPFPLLIHHGCQSFRKVGSINESRFYHDRSRSIDKAPSRPDVIGANIRAGKAFREFLYKVKFRFYDDLSNNVGKSPKAIIFENKQPLIFLSQDGKTKSRREN